MRTFWKFYKFGVSHVLRLQFPIHTLIWLKLSYAKWCLHIFICFSIKASQTKSTEYQTKHANNVKLICNKCHNFVLQQDGARCRAWSYPLSFICAHVVKPLETKFGLPHTPDRNPLDYYEWLFIEFMVHKHQHVTELVEEIRLKKKIVK